MTASDVSPGYGFCRYLDQLGAEDMVCYVEVLSSSRAWGLLIHCREIFQLSLLLTVLED
jgi:hypothetical protein